MAYTVIKKKSTDPKPTKKKQEWRLGQAQNKLSRQKEIKKGIVTNVVGEAGKRARQNKKALRKDIKGTKKEIRTLRKSIRKDYD